MGTEQCERGGKGKRERGGNEAKEQSIISVVFEGILLLDIVLSRGVNG